jgi:hypothetical protein
MLGCKEEAKRKECGLSCENEGSGERRRLFSAVPSTQGKNACRACKQTTKGIPPLQVVHINRLQMKEQVLDKKTLSLIHCEYTVMSRFAI